MAGGGGLQYIWELIDKISPVLAKVDKAVAQSTAKVEGLKKSAAGLDTVMGKEVAGLEKAAKAAERYAKSVEQVQKRSADAHRSMESQFRAGGRYGPFSEYWYQQQRAIEAANREGDAFWSKQRARAGGSGGGMGGGVLMDPRGRLRHRNGRFAPMGGGPGMIEAAVGGHYVWGGLKRVGRILASEDILHIQRQMKSAGVAESDITAARAEATRVAALFPNVSTSEALDLASDLRAIFPAHGDKSSQAIATEHLAAVAKKMSFLRSYEGGKHAATGDAALKEMMAGARSAEMFGKTSPEEFSRFLDWAIASKTAFGKTLSLQQMNTAQRQAVTSLMNVDEKFRFGAFNALVQTMGQRAGTALQSYSQKIVSGLNWKKGGLAELAGLGLAGPDGKPNEALARLASKDPTQAVMQMVGAIKAKYGDDPIKLQQSLARLMGERTAAAFPMEVVQNLARLESMWKQVEAAYEAQRKAEGGGWFGASAGTEITAISKAWDDLRNKMTEPINPAVIWGLQKVRETMKGLGDFFEKHPVIAGAAASTLALGATAATLAGIRLGWGMLRYGPAALAALAGAGGAGLGAGAGAAAGWAARGAGFGGFLLGAGKWLGINAIKGGIWGIIGLAIGEALQNKEFQAGIAGFVRDHGKAGADWLENNKAHQKRVADYDAAQKQFDANGGYQALWDSLTPPKVWSDQPGTGFSPGRLWRSFWAGNDTGWDRFGADVDTTAGIAADMMARGATPAMPNLDANRPAIWGAAAAGAGAVGTGGVPAAEAQREIAVRSLVDVNVRAENGITVNYTGPLDGPKNVPIRGEASRGESAAVTK